jgi:TPR repeat protein
MPRITISYRREDSGVITGRIFDRLAAHYGREAVFRDIDSIPPGVDFRDHINVVLDNSDIVLAIVGPRWVGQRAGQSRLAEESDPVRVEIEAALRKGMPLIPVLVLKAGMPRLAQLPDSLKNFAYRNSVQVDAGQDFDVHMSRLITAMDRILGQHGEGAAPLVAPEERRQAAPPLPAAGSANPAAARERSDLPLPAPMPAATGSRRAGRRAAAGLGIAILGAALGIAATLGIGRYLTPAGQPVPVPQNAAAAQAAEAKATAAQRETAAAREQAATMQRDLADRDRRLHDAVSQIDRLNDRIKALDGQLARAPDRTAPSLADLPAAEQTRMAQHALRVLGYFQGNVDGLAGSDTRAAINQFQLSEGMPATGQLSDPERRHLLDLSERVAALLDRPAVSPKGLAANAVRGGGQRYAKAYGFDKGTGARQDPVEAAYWYALAAADGQANALTNLGILFARGSGLDKPDPLDARVLWQAAAARGEAIAMYNLGVLYERGIGVPASVGRARYWYDRAAAANNPEAQAALKRLAR